MDEQLAAIYGTNQVEYEEDQEKLAAAEMLVKLAEEQGVDINDLSDQEIIEMTNQLYGRDEAQEKIAEADYLGRVIAHACAQEMRNIEKNAGRVGDAAKAVGKWFKERPEHYGTAGHRIKQVFTGKHPFAKDKKLTVGQRLKALASAAKEVSPEAGAVAATGGTAYGVHKYRQHRR